MFFKNFASKNQLTGFYISGTLVENGLNKKRFNITRLSLYILTLTIEFNDPEKCRHVIISLILDYHTGEPLSKWFQLRFPPQHKKLVKTNDNQSIITMKFNPIFQEKRQGFHLVTLWGDKYTLMF